MSNIDELEKRVAVLEQLVEALIADHNEDSVQKFQKEFGDLLDRMKPVDFLDRKKRRKIVEIPMAEHPAPIYTESGAAFLPER